MKRAIVLGAGGHAKVTVELLRVCGYEVVGVVSPDAVPGAEVLGATVLGGDDQLPRLRGDGVEHAAIGVGSVGPDTIRGELFERVRALGFEVPVLIHPAATVSPAATLEEGVTVCAGAVIQAGAVLSTNVLVNTRAVVEHDTRVGAHGHVASGAVLAGDVVVGARTLIGAGATVRQGTRIGSDAVVGLGAAVVADVPDGVTVLGVPARQREDQA